MSQEVEAAMVDEYLHSDPRPTIAALAQRHGVSRQTVYSILDRNRVNRQLDQQLLPNELLDRMADRALATLIEELAAARQENEHLRAELDRLRAG